jgi:hypothetical protein
MAKAQIHVEGFHGGTHEKPEFLTLFVQYAETSVRIELPVIEPLYAREPGVEVYRRQMHDLIAALQEWELSLEPISWRDPRKT